MSAVDLYRVNYNHLQQHHPSFLILVSSEVPDWEEPNLMFCDSVGIDCLLAGFDMKWFRCCGCNDPVPPSIDVERELPTNWSSL